MTAFDWLAIVVVAFSFIRGFLRGMTRTVISSLAFFTGLAIALVLYADLAIVIKHLGVATPLAYAVGFLVPIGLAWLGGWWLARYLCRRFRKTPLATLDRLGGGALGIGRAWLILSVIYLYLVLTAFPVQPDFVLQARVTPVIKPGARLLTDLGKADLKNCFEQGVAKLRHLKEVTLHPKPPKTLPDVAQEGGREGNRKASEVIPSSRHTAPPTLQR
ncbi:MAG: CvpA family protein [Acidobacteriota bacterium]